MSYNIFAPTQSNQLKHANIFVPEANSVPSQPSTVQSQPIVQSQPVQQVQPQTKVVTPIEKPAPKVNPDSSIDGINALAQMYTSPEEEERLRKASVTRQRIMAVGDALRHIGNIYNTVGGGSPQQFNSPVELERNRYLQERGLRDARNMKYMTYQQAKAVQEQKAKELEMKHDQWKADYGLKVADAARKAGLTDAQIKAMNDRIANQKTYQEGYLRARNRALDNQAAHYKEQERQGRQRIGIAAQNAKNAQAYRQFKMNGGGGSKGRVTFRGKNGFYSRQMSSADLNSFYNQAYDRLKKTKGANGRPIIDEGGILAGMPDDSLFGKRITQQEIKKAVDKAMWEHPEVGKMLQDDYEFDFDPRGSQEQAQQAPMAVNTNFAPWNSNAQYPSSTYTPGYTEDDEIEDMLGDDDLSEINIYN